MRREGELAVRAALGAGTGALRRTLLGESLVLCGAGAILGVLLARPLVAVVSRYAARFSVRANDVTVDASLLWVGAGLAIIAAVVLAYVPRLPSPHAPTGFGLASAGVRITPGTNRRLRRLRGHTGRAVVRAARRRRHAAHRAHRVAEGEHRLQHAPGAGDRRPDAARGAWARNRSTSFTKPRAASRELPGVQRVAVGNVVPVARRRQIWPRRAVCRRRLHAGGRRREPARTAAQHHAWVSSRRSASRSLAGRDFTDDDRRGSELVVIVSQSVAQRLFPNGDAINRHFWWTDPYFGKPAPRRIVGVVADVDDENVVPGPAMTVYHPFRQMPFANRVFVHTAGDPYSLVTPVTRIIREMSADQPVERAATLADVRAEVLAPERLNAFVLSGFGGVALLIAVVGVAGVLAFSVSARTREFGVRLAIGSTPRGPAGARPVAGCAHRRRSGSSPVWRAATRSAAWRRATSRTCGCRARCRSLVRPPSSSAPPSSPR